MATTTPNYGWPVPTSTDLVKNGAVAIEGLGDAIDASLLDLRGGTTGQVLAKQTNAQMDFAWVTDATGISPTIVDAKGDLIAATANDTPARLAVGADGSTLVANSAASTGLMWAGQPYANPVLNSAFQVWQRGTSIASGGGVYTADRWYSCRGSLVSGGTVSRQTTSDATNLPFIQYCARIQRDSGNTGTQGLNFGQNFETVNSIAYAGKTITFSFYARAGANFSSASSQLGAALATGTGTDQNGVIGNYTSQSTPISQNATLTTTWQRFSYSATLNTNANELYFVFNYTPVGTAGANDYFEVTGVQIDLGSVALPFKTYAGTIAGELAACQRYYYRMGGDSLFQIISMTGWFPSTTQANLMLQNPVQLRVAPSVLEFSTLQAISISNGNAFSLSSGAINNASTLQSLISFTVSGATAGQMLYGRTNNSLSGYIALSAEL